MPADPCPEQTSIRPLLLERLLSSGLFWRRRGRPCAPIGGPLERPTSFVRPLSPALTHNPYRSPCTEHMVDGHKRHSPRRAAMESELAYRRGSVHRAVTGTGWVAIHLSGLPGDIGRAGRPTFDLAPGGVYLAAGSPRRWCALTAPFHPYLWRRSLAPHRRFDFCGTVLRVTPTGR